MKRGKKLTPFDNDQPPAGKLHLLILEWKYLSRIERAEISLRLAYWLNHVPAPTYVEICVNPLIIGTDEP